VYGLVRSGQAGSSSQKYVGGLGHESDANTGLIYMRARYMDPVLGRFLSEDPGRDGGNWFVYCESNPINFLDSNGKIASQLAILWFGLISLIALFCPDLQKIFLYWIANAFKSFIASSKSIQELFSDSADLLKENHDMNSIVTLIKTELSDALSAVGSLLWAGAIIALISTLYTAEICAVILGTWSLVEWADEKGLP
jgi:RHS repeat-associated protein